MDRPPSSRSVQQATLTAPWKAVPKHARDKAALENSTLQLYPVSFYFTTVLLESALHDMADHSIGQANVL